MSFPVLLPEHSTAYEVGHALGVVVRCLGMANILFLLARRFQKIASL